MIEILEEMFKRVLILNRLYKKMYTKLIVVERVEFYDKVDERI